MALDLTKKNEQLTISLTKRKISSIVAQVGTAFDVSGSMRDEYRDGLMQTFAERLMPIALRFDDNGQIDNWAFDTRSHYVGEITIKNIETFVNEKVRPLVGGATEFSPVLIDIFDHYFTNTTKSLFGSKKVEITVDTPVYLIFQTDGENTDKRETENILGKLESKGIYIQFVGIGTDTSFSFIKKMGEKFSNVGFMHIPDLRKMSDEQIYDLLINEEFKEFMKTRFPSKIQVIA